MPVGFQSIGDHGVYQIDELYQNLQLRAKGTFANHTAVSLANATMPVIAVRTTHANGALFIGGGFSGSTYTFNFRNPVVSGDYWIFDVPVDSGNVGLQIFNAAGAMVFDSSLDYMKMAGAATIGTSTEPAGKTYAWIQTGTGLNEANSGSSGSIYRQGYALLFDGSSPRKLIKGPATPLQTVSGSSPLGHVRDPAALLVDVTGL